MITVSQKMMNRLLLGYNKLPGYVETMCTTCATPHSMAQACWAPGLKYYCHECQGERFFRELTEVQLLKVRISHLEELNRRLIAQNAAFQNQLENFDERIEGALIRAEKAEKSAESETVKARSKEKRAEKLVREIISELCDHATASTDPRRYAERTEIKEMFDNGYLHRVFTARL